MSPPRRRDDPAALRRFLLERSPDEGSPRLAPEERDHALRVLRLGPGDRLSGLDGRGAEWPLVVRAAGRRELELESAGDPRREPAPGSGAGAPPRVELCLPPPRGARAEALVERATQLGVTTLRWTVFARSHPEARALPAGRAARLERVAAQACKQCGRLWLPELIGPQPLEEVQAAVAAARACVLDPDPGAPRLAEVARGAAHLALFVGPEGGLDPDDRERLAAQGAQTAWLAPYVLRVETAAEAALAVVAHLAPQ